MYVSSLNGHISNPAAVAAANLSIEGRLMLLPNMARLFVTWPRLIDESTGCAQSSNDIQHPCQCSLIARKSETQIMNSHPITEPLHLENVTELLATTSLHSS
jgi:hypothetical protein